MNIIMSLAASEYAWILLRMHELDPKGEVESPEVDDLCAELAPLWDGMSSLERIRLTGLSQDLYALSDGRVGEEMNKIQQDLWYQNFNSHQDEGNPDAFLAFLRDPFPSSYENRIWITVMAWQSKCWNWLNEPAVSRVFTESPQRHISTAESELKEPVSRVKEAESELTESASRVKEAESVREPRWSDGDEACIKYYQDLRPLTRTKFLALLTDKNNAQQLWNKFRRGFDLYAMRANQSRGEYFWINLSNLDLRNVSPGAFDLRGIDLRGADLRNVNLRDSYFYGADLKYANLAGSVLTGCDFTKVDFSNTNLSGADLSWSNLTNATLDNARLSGASLVGANLAMATVTQAKLDNCFMDNIRVRGALFRDNSGRPIIKSGFKNDSDQYTDSLPYIDSMERIDPVTVDIFVDRNLTQIEIDIIGLFAILCPQDGESKPVRLIRYWEWQVGGVLRYTGPSYNDVYRSLTSILSPILTSLSIDWSKTLVQYPVRHIPHVLYNISPAVRRDLARGHHLALSISGSFPKLAEVRILKLMDGRRPGHRYQVFGDPELEKLRDPIPETQLAGLESIFSLLGWQGG